jgi:uncharacterized protein (DUF58 family)
VNTELLDPIAIARLGSMALRARYIALGALAGLHRSRRRGSSVEFSEHKEYSPGDELRHIDWKAYGKLDKYYVKRFEEETELRAYLVVDSSGSMGYARAPSAGQPAVSKLRYASFLAAGLSYLLLRQQDPVGLLLVKRPGRQPHERLYIPPRAREGHLANVLDELEAARAEGDTDLVGSLKHLSEIIRPRSLVVVLSDLFEPRLADAISLLRGLRARRHDVAVFQLLDADELAFPFRELLRFQAMEDEPREVLCDARATRSSYMKALNEFTSSARRSCEAGDVEYHLIETSTPVDRALLDFLVKRSRSFGQSRSLGRASGDLP